MTQGWWNWPGWPLAEEWSAWWAFLTFLVTLAAASAALFQLRNYIREREEASRPFVVVDFDFRSVLMLVEVKNISETIATKVTLRVNPPFSARRRADAEKLNAIFSDGYEIRQLAPGRRIQWTLDRAPDYMEDKHPLNYEVNVRYEDPRRLRRDRAWWPWGPKRPKVYEDTFDLNMGQWSTANAEVDYDDKNWNINNRNEARVTKVAAALEAIADQLEETNERPPRKGPVQKRGRR